MRSIRQVIRVNLIGLSIAILLLTVVITNVGIQVFFRNYIEGKRRNEDKVILALVEEAMSDYRLDINEVFFFEQLTRKNGFRMQIFDNENAVIFESIHMPKGNGKGNGLFERPLIRNREILEIDFKDEHIKVENEIVGILKLGHPKGRGLSEDDKGFLVTMNITFMIVFLAAIILVIIISQLLSRKLSKPIEDIREGTELIAKGNYTDVCIDKSDTKELHALAFAVEQLATQLEQQEKLRKQLTTDISHELRSPIAVIRSQIEAMIDGIFEMDKKRLTRCNQEIQRLTQLIDDLNELSLVENKLYQLDKQQVNISQIVKEQLLAYDSLFAKKGITLQVNIDENVMLTCDVKRMKQIVNNIVLNALKYTEKGTVIVGMKEDDKQVHFYVEDTGIGIPEGELNKIFERFYRTDKSRNRETGGAGIGLAIVKKLVEAHGGTIEVFSEVNVGTTFNVYFKNVY